MQENENRMFGFQMITFLRKKNLTLNWTSKTTIKDNDYRVRKLKKIKQDWMKSHNIICPVRERILDILGKKGRKW